MPAEYTLKLGFLVIAALNQDFDVFKVLKLDCIELFVSEQQLGEIQQPLLAIAMD